MSEPSKATSQANQPSKTRIKLKMSTPPVSPLQSRKQSKGKQGAQLGASSDVPLDIGLLTKSTGLKLKVGGKVAAAVPFQQPRDSQVDTVSTG
eukprot:scaffold101502_cov41-Prasinocladus_malaysianus.AAC.1